MTIQVMLVDDSATVRNALAGILSKSEDIDVIASAEDPACAMQEMETQMPDVMILDVEMPRTNGLTFLKKIMTENPIPVVVCSALTPAASKVSIQALGLGAVSVIEKPDTNNGESLADSESLIIESVRTAARANLKQLSQQVSGKPAVKPTPETSHDAALRRHNINVISDSKLVAIGASTGGTLALEEIFKRLPENSPAIVVVQHMPQAFIAAFAERLDLVSNMHVKEAVHGDEVKAGVVLIAAGGKQMRVESRLGRPCIVLEEGTKVSGHKPSVDVLFRSVAETVGKNALGIILTGLGDDGADGLKEMRATGAHTLGQDEASCIIYGMPAVAMENGAVEKQISLDLVADAIITFARRM